MRGGGHGHGVAPAAARGGRRCCCVARGLHCQGGRQPQARASGVSRRCAETSAGCGVEAAGGAVWWQAGEEGLQGWQYGCSCAEACSRSVNRVLVSERVGLCVRVRGFVVTDSGAML